jgi:photosystem II stability/assembly factor-like uncharacterized protein
VRAAAASPAAWQPTGLAERALRLSVTPGGALYARTERGLLRSSDGGATWIEVPLPPAPARGERSRELVTTDPTAEYTLYVHGAAGLYRSDDDGADWRVIVPTEARFLGLAVSPVDPHLLYLALAYGEFYASELVLMRSHDGGATWETLPEARSERCLWTAPILQAHPTDGGRLFLATGCVERPGLMGASIQQSFDRGMTWSALPTVRQQTGWRLLGGQGSAPERLYLDTSFNPDVTSNSAAYLARSDDDGQTWSQVMILPRTVIQGLAYDPTAPDRVYVGFRRGAVWSSDDGGGTWQPLGDGVTGELSDLALAADRRGLFAATSAGVWRLPLAS